MEIYQAQKLLELSRAAGKIANVKTCVNGDRRSHPGRAIFIGLLGKDKAIVKPFNHGKQEVVPLDSIGFWKSGCDFDIGEAMNAIREARPTVTPVNIVYVVFSEKMQGVWNEHRRWVRDIERASRYTERSHAARAVGKLNKVQLQDDAKVMTKEDAAVALLDILTRPKTQMTTPAPSAIPSRLLAATKPLPQKTSSLPDDDLVDVSVLFNENEISLRQAEGERKIAFEEYANIKRSLSEAIQKLKDLNSRVVELGGRSILKSEKAEAGKRSKRLLIRGPIQEVLKIHSRLDAVSIFNRIKDRPDLVGITKKKMMQCISGMVAHGLLEEGNGGWQLTASGYKTDMMAARD